MKAANASVPGFGAVLGSEFLKLRRNAIVWATFLAYGIMVAVGALFMWMLANPAAAAGLGLISQKANLAVGGMEANWATFLYFLLEMAGLGGLIFLSFILTFVFGREYAEGTAKNLLALPCPRPWFALAKFLIATAWFATLVVFSLAASLAAGFLLGLGGFSPSLFLAHAAKISIVSLLDLCLGPFVAWVAVRSRGYIAPLAATIATLLAAVAVGSTEWGRYFPWSVVLWYSGAGGSGKELVAGSFLVMAAACVLGAAAAILREERADNCQ